MRLLIDEDVPVSCVARLRAAGVDVVDLREIAPRGRTDDDVSALAEAEGLVLLTGQHGFGSTARYPAARRPRTIVVGTHDAAVPVLGDAILAAMEE